MKPNTNPNTTDEQTQKNTQMSAPEAAAKRDVQEAEQKAETAKQEAREAKQQAAEDCEALRQEIEALREEREELRSLLERTIASVRHVDVHLDRVEDATRGVGGYYESEPIAEQTQLPEYDELETVTVSGDELEEEDA